MAGSDAAYRRIEREIHYDRLYSVLAEAAERKAMDPLALKLEERRKKTGNPELSVDIQWLQSRLKDHVVYSEEQGELIRRGIGQRVTVILGGSGTGKATVAEGLRTAFSSLHMEVKVVAPTRHTVRSIGQRSGCGKIPCVEDLRTLTGTEMAGTVWMIADFPKAEPGKLADLIVTLGERDRVILVGNPADLPVRCRGEWQEKEGNRWLCSLKTLWISERRPGESVDEERLMARIRRSPFRNGFSLREQDKKYIREKGIDLVEAHAKDMIAKRLAPAYIENDGQQTPMKGHPVFPAQHATACCCRGCLYQWYRIPKGRELTEEEQDFVVSLLMTWIRDQMKKG